jgi:dynein intermediate chain 2
MTDTFPYQKKWKEFGRPPNFEDTEVKILGTVPPDPNQADEYVEKNPNQRVFSNIPDLSYHSVNTERTPITSRGMSHT